MSKNRAIWSYAAIVWLLVSALVVYACTPVECRCCHNSDENRPGACVLHKRTGSCYQDYFGRHANKPDCGWCGAKGKLSRIEAWLD